MFELPLIASTITLQASPIREKERKMRMRSLGSGVQKGRHGRHWSALLLFILLFSPALAGAWERSGSNDAAMAAAAGTVAAASTTTATALQATDCTECHGTNVVAAHHQTTYFTSGQCTYCHTGVTTSGDCAGCHTFVPQQNKHHATQAATTGDCAKCHTAVGNLGDCASCHQGAIREPHHATTFFNNGECTACHTTLTGGDGCQSCHGANTRSAHHTAAETRNIACSSCHTGIAVNSNCTDCHTAAYWGAGQTAASTHHAVAESTNRTCNDCHSGVTPISGCGDCHSFSTGNRHHETALGTLYGVVCSSCHETVWNGFTTKYLPPTEADCEACHTGVTQGTTGPVFPVATIPTVHHATPPATSGNCEGCHQGIGSVAGGLDCAACHATQLKDGGPAMHHATDTATTIMPDGSIGDCAFCHVGVSVSGLDCSSCHDGVIAPPGTPATHHATQKFKDGLCTDCHQGAGIEGIGCAACHDPGTSNPRNHHGQPAYAAGACNTCHDTIQLNGSSCQDCHTSDIPALHHDAPLTRVGGDCGVCHQSVSDPAVCANCHQASPHHTTSWSLDGDCAHCHTVPDWAQDRPMQAACRECHGPYQHGKNTQPIQDYGACAYCHNQDTFHAAPGGPVGYTRSAPGKGKFALFWSQYTHNGSEEVRENVSPNGEDMNDEGGRRWRDPSLSFTMKQISNKGRTYSVPAFPDLPGTSRDTAAGGGGSTPPPAAEVNLALNKSASASSYESSSYSASKAVDGSTSSSWWKNSDRSHWLRVDLGQRQAIAKVVVKWGQEYARQYDVEVSNDGYSWSRVLQEGSGNGGTDTIGFSSREARYVRVYCRSENRNGYQISELEVYK